MSGRPNPYYVSKQQARPPLAPVAMKSMPTKQVSIHEMQTAELARQGGAQEGADYAAGTAAALVPLPSPVTSVQFRGVYDSSFMLDTLFRTSEDLTKASRTFAVKPLNNNNDLSTVVEVKVYPFYFPRLNVTAGKPDPFYLRRVYLTIQELPTTAAIGTATGSPYHFEFQVGNVNSAAVLLTPIEDKMYFQIPVQSITALTLRFLMPPTMTQISLPQDNLTLFMMPPTPNSGAPPPYIYNAQPVKFAFTNSTQWSAISGINVAANPARTTVPVFPANYASTALPINVAAWVPTIDTGTVAIDNVITTTQGWFITSVGDPITAPPALPVPGYYLPYGYFEIAALTTAMIQGTVFPPINPIDFPGFIQNSIGVPVTVQVRKNRIAMPMRFTSLQTPSINGMLPTHV